jgi:hypothetical protein
LRKPFLFPAEIGRDTLDFKILLATAFMLSLVIPFLIKPINGQDYNINQLNRRMDELNSLKAYCYLHADREARGEKVINDLVNSGLANSEYRDLSCSKIDDLLSATDGEIGAFRMHCELQDLNASEYWKCKNAGYEPKLSEDKGKTNDASTTNLQELTTGCHDDLNRHLGREPSEFEMNNCVQSACVQSSLDVCESKIK